MNKNLNNQKLHIIFLSILSLNYIVPLLVFGNVTLFYHDTLDSEIVFNKIIADSYKDNFTSLNILLNGEIKIEFLRRVFQPFTLFYFFFSAELAYFLVDILVKLTSYFSFFILSKQINKDIFICAIGAALFASLNERTVEGFGFAFFPYLIYLASFKKNLNFKHYFITFVFGLNTDLVTCLISIPTAMCLIYIINLKNEKRVIKDSFMLFTTFALAIFISNFNLIYGQLQSSEIQRTAFYYESISLQKNILTFLYELFKLPTNLDWTFLEKLPQFLIIVIVFALYFFQKNQKTFKIICLILFINLIPFLFRTEFITFLRNSSEGIFKTFRFEYVTSILPLFFCISLMLVLKDKKINFQILKLLFPILFFFQINSSLVPVYKKYVINIDNYRNLYTFNGYYMNEDYQKIKSVVGKNKTISIGYDPMIAAMNRIYVIDGYQNIYPLFYKLKFRKIIEKELNKNDKLKKYFDNWGNRLYAFVNNQKQIEINFNEAKNLGASFVISKYEITNSDLKLVTNSFKFPIYLYKLH